MSAQSPFIIPLKGLSQGVHTYELSVDDDFFATFETSPVETADVNLILTVDRSSRGLLLGFDFSGTIAATCDRCTADINLPISDKRELIVKLVSETEGLEDEADLIYLDAATNLFNAAPYAYEMILLAIPMIRTYDCRAGAPPYPCDEDMLQRIDDTIDQAATEPQPDEVEQPEDGKPSPWDVLKDLK